MPYADTDFFLALVKDKDWLKARAGDLLAAYSDQLWTSLFTLIEILLVADRYKLAVALQRVEPDGLSRISYQELEQRALCCAARLSAIGIKRGDRVILAAKNHPDWGR